MICAGESIAAADLPTIDSAVWFAEGTRLGDVPFQSRLEAVEAEEGRALVLWSSPPSPELLHWLVETLAPSELYLIGPRYSGSAIGRCAEAGGRHGKVVSATRL